jgi:hypothetical protein
MNKNKIINNQKKEGCMIIIAKKNKYRLSKGYYVKAIDSSYPSSNSYAQIYEYDGNNYLHFKINKNDNRGKTLDLKNIKICEISDLEFAKLIYAYTEKKSLIMQEFKEMEEIINNIIWNKTKNFTMPFWTFNLSDKKKFLSEIKSEIIEETESRINKIIEIEKNNNKNLNNNNYSFLA